MAEKFTITLIPEYKKHFPPVKKYLEDLGHKINVIEKKDINKIENSNLVILFVETITFDTIAFVENSLIDFPVILNYDFCPDEISLESFAQKLTFHEKEELNQLLVLIENAQLKFNLLNKPSRDKELNSTFLDTLGKIFTSNVHKIRLEEFLDNGLSQITRYTGANEYSLFLLPKFKSFNFGAYKNLTEKYDIKKLTEYYPEIEYDLLMESLKKNQELIIFKKNGNLKTDVSNEATIKHYYSLIIFPLFINEILSGCIVFNFKKAVENINQLRHELVFITKCFSFQLQYKIIYSQYENSINQFSRLINNAVNGIYQSTEDGGILYANPAFLKILGYDSLNELRDIDLFTQVYYSKSDRDSFINKIKREKAVQNFESKIKKKNGEIINILENSRIVENADGSIIFEGIIQDITNQINLKEKLKYQTSFSEKLIENAAILILAVNEKNEIIMWNSLAEEVTGYERNEIFKDSGLLKKIFNGGESFEELINHTRNNQQNNDYLTNENIEIVAKDGTKKLFRFSWVVNDYLGESKKQVIGFGVDITETAKLEEQLYESQKMESLGTLAAGMAYDFTSILNDLNVYNSSLKSIIKSDSKESEYVDKIEDTIFRASTFTSKLIGLSKKEKKHTVEIDVNSCINYVLDLLEHTVNENIKLEKDICTLPMIKGDLSQVHQVILNIAINANESISGEGKIRFKTEIVMAKTDENLSTIKIEGTNFVKITISDTGKGIPAELQQRIFDPFFSTKISEKGAGLGLSVVYNIIKNHKGYIFVNSVLNKGSTFYIYFPYVGDPSKIYSEELVENGKTKTTDKKRKVKPQILIVDDEVIIRDLLNDVLIDHNYEIISAKDGLEGLEKYEKHKDTIDLVILDIIMPGLTGDEVFLKIRKINPESKIIITSGYSKQKITEKLMASGANGFLPKPFNIDKLLGLIKALVEEN